MPLSSVALTNAYASVSAAVATLPKYSNKESGP